MGWPKISPLASKDRHSRVRMSIRNRSLRRCTQRPSDGLDHGIGFGQQISLVLNRLIPGRCAGR